MTFLKLKKPNPRRSKEDNMSKGKIVIGMSGGVDSSVAAFLLKQEGYDVTGVTMLFWQDKTGKSDSAAEDAARVAGQLGIPHSVIDFRKAFREKVVDYFADEYINGRTPNPCLVCNRYLKWEALLLHAASIGADLIGTGHYARILRLPNGRLTVARADASSKDQSYALYMLTQAQLERTVMPVGSYSKEEIRGIAEAAGLAVASKPDSQEICFVPDKDYASFIEKYRSYSPEPGAFVDCKGNVLGRHAGIIHYTVGQRKGLGIAFGEPRFVTALRPDTNEVVLGTGKEVWSSSLRCGDVCLMAVDRIEEDRKVTAKIRYNHSGSEAIIHPVDEDGTMRVDFPEPVRAVTPGQAVVFYEDGHVLGGGTIIS
jgi:tRNA-specific 2-thiouridylase